jgi:hypothetical protein
MLGLVQIGTEVDPKQVLVQLDLGLKLVLESLWIARRELGIVWSGYLVNDSEQGKSALPSKVGGWF